MVRKKTHEEFLDEVKALVGDEYKILGEYVNTTTKISMKHNVCGYEYEVTPSSFISGRRCPKCSGKMKKTTEIFKKEVYNLVGNEYEVLGEYKNSNTKILFKHDECDHKYEVVPRSFLNGIRCPKCAGVVKKTTEQYKKEVYGLVGDEYEVLGEYINNQKKIKMKHNECEYVYSVKPNLFLNGCRCPKCSGLMKKTTESFKQEVCNLVGNEYSVLGEYVNSKTKIKMKHSICGCEYEVQAGSFLNGNRCPKCSSKKKTTKQFKKEVFELVGNEYEVLGNYKDTNTKIIFKHNKCKYEYDVRPNGFLQGTRCPKCAGLTKKTTEQYKNEVYDLVGDEYEVIGEYKDNKTKVEMKHEVCGYEYKVTPNGFLKGNRCPKCASSKGEKRVSDLLDRFNCSYERQYSYSNCRYKKPLPFDFAIFNSDNTINCLIEYDGVQHFEPIEYFGGEEGFKGTQKRDQIKNQYCKDNNIKLIRILYWDFDNIEDILNEELKDLINNNEGEVSA